MSAEATQELDELIDEHIDGEIGSEGGEGGKGEDKPTKPSQLETAVAELAKTQKTILERVEKPTEKKVEDLTPEEKAEFWAIYEPEKSDKDFMKKWFRLNPEATEDEIKAVRDMFADVQKGLVRQSVKGSKNYVDYVIKQLKDEFGPIREYVENSRAEATRGRFFKTYEALDDKKYEKIIQATATGLADKTFENEDEYFKALAEGAAETIKGVIPEFDLGKKKETAGKAPKLPRTSVGGGGGAGKGSGSEPSKSEDKSGDIWED